MYVEVKFDFCNQLTKTFLVECLFINSLFLLIGEFAIFLFLFLYSVLRT